MSIKDENTFQYIYSAKQQDEIKRIRQKYISVEEDKMTQLRKLDQSVTRSDTIAAIVVGLIGTLIFGGGLSCCLLWSNQYLFLGIVLGIIGMLVMSVSYPLFVCIAKKKRQKLAPEILKLTEEMLK